jgi:hypothetical protein
MEDRSPACSSRRAAISKLFCNGQGRMIGAVTALNTIQGFDPRLCAIGNGSATRPAAQFSGAVEFFVFALGLVIVVGVSWAERWCLRRCLTLIGQPVGNLSTGARHHQCMLRGQGFNRKTHALTSFMSDH